MILSNLPDDCIKEICQFLTLTDLQEVRMLSKSWRSALVNDTIFFTSILKNYFLSLSEHEKLEINSENAYKLLCKLRERFLNGKLLNVQQKVLYASSSDRWKETALNMEWKGDGSQRELKCYELMSLRPDLPLDRLQLFCRCCFDTPCYWSSTPSTDENSVETLIIQCTPLSIVEGLLVRPYQATWHPDSPIYSPREVVIEFLSWTTNPVAYPQLPSRRNRCDSFKADLNILFSEHAYYTSPTFPINHSNKPQFLRLPTPQMLLGGRIRISFRGKHQRQTLGGDDFYLCLNPCVVYGVPIDLSSLPGSECSTFSIYDFNDVSISHEPNSKDPSFRSLPAAPLPSVLT